MRQSEMGPVQSVLAPKQQALDYHDLTVSGFSVGHLLCRKEYTSFLQEDAELPMLRCCSGFRTVSYRKPSVPDLCNLGTLLVKLRFGNSELFFHGFYSKS